MNDLKPQEPDEMVEEFAIRLNEWCRKLDLDQVEAEYAQKYGVWQSVQYEICQRLPENRCWSRMSVFMTDM